MKLKPLPIGLMAAAAFGAAGYGLYLAGMDVGMNRGMGMAAVPVATTQAGDAAPPTAGLGAVPQSIAQGEQATRRHITAGIKAGDVDPATGQKVLYYHDPMVPGNKFDKPAKSPFMDMMLVPVYASAGAGDPADQGVTISPRAQQNLGVRTAEVAMGTLAPDIQAVGSVAWNERDVAVVPARAAGFVEKLYGRAALDPVSKGQALADLYVPDWVAAQEEFLSGRRLATRPGALGLGDLVDAARQRMRLAGMSEDQIARVESAGVVQARMTITAPISGVLVDIGVREGSSVAAGMQIARINGLATVWVNAELPQALAAQVRTGMAVEARTSAGTSATGKVGAVLPEINATTRTIKVRVELPNADRQLVPGMFATLHFKPAARQGALLIPSEALIVTGTRNVVMVAQDSGQFMPVEVETGVESNGQTEIKKGLKAGQRVVLSGQFLVDSEASLKGVETRQAAGSASGAKP